MYTTTLNQIRENHACERGYDLIANHVGNDFEGTIDLRTILEVNGMSDCIWALRATSGGKELSIAFAIYCSQRYYSELTWIKWARKWMIGKDRSKAAADAASAVAAYAAANASANAYAAAYAAACAASANAAGAANAAALAASDSVASSARADAYAAERKWQQELLLSLLS
jgi:hypothetical protein